MQQPKKKKSISYCNLQYNRALGYVMLFTKIYKNRLNNLQKTALKSMLEVGAILEPTWPHLGTVLRPKMEPNWHQIPSKIDFQIDQKNNHIFNHSWDDFFSILGPNLAPKRGPRTNFSTSFSFLAPSWGQDAPKVPPRSPQDPPKTTPRHPQDPPKTPPRPSKTYQKGPERSLDPSPPRPPDP